MNQLMKIKLVGNAVKRNVPVRIVYQNKLLSSTLSCNNQIINRLGCNNNNNNRNYNIVNNNKCNTSRHFHVTGNINLDNGEQQEELSKGTVSIDTIYEKLRYLAKGLKDEEERETALKKINAAYEAHKVETDEDKIQELLLDAQSHLTFYKMVSRRRLPKELDEDKDELSAGQHFVMDKKTGELVETDSVLSEKLVGNANKIIDKSQVTAEHRRKHDQLLRRQHFLGRK